MSTTATASTPTMTIDVWSDLACPWCYVGKRRLEAALARLDSAATVEVRWRAFELDASAPPAIGGDYVERLAKKYRKTPEQAQAMIDRLTSIAAEDGLAMRFDRIRAGNTFAAHRVLKAAVQHGLDKALKERLFAAYFTEGALLSDRETLVRLASEVGLAAEIVGAALDEPRYGDAVRADESLAKELEITGVPFYVLAEEIGIPGAQPVEILAEEIGKAWRSIVERAASVPPGEIAAAAACDARECEAPATEPPRRE